LLVRYDVRALCGDVFVVLGEGAEAGAVREAGVGDNVDDFRSVAQVAQQRFPVVLRQELEYEQSKAKL
jgi:hypothetical protein